MKNTQDTPMTTALFTAFENTRPLKKQKTAAKSAGEEKAGEDGNDLFREVIEARKASEARLKGQEEEYASILAIGEMACTAESLAQQMHYSRLLADGSREKLQLALQLLGEQEAALKKRLGLPPEEEKIPAEDIPHPGRPITEQDNTPPRMQAPFPAASPPFPQASLHDLIQSAESYFRLYRDEPGHDIRMQHIRQYFRDPARISEFLAIHEPQGWAAQFQYMYDNIILPPSGYAGERRDSFQAQYAREDDAPPSTTEALILRNMERMGL